MNKLNYTNKNGNYFEIEFLNADVPLDADYFGYLIKVVADNNDKMVYEYKACVYKSLCPSEQSSRLWLNNVASEFLKEILETYNNGKTLMLLPNSNGKWFIL